MVELYRIKTSGEILELDKAPFSDETKDLEDFVLKNEGILGNIALLNHQITLPDDKRIDIWGIDTLEMRPIVVELKNTVAGLEVIPQILPYYNFVKSNPDTLKFKALSSERFMKKLKALGGDRDKLDKGLEADPRIILVGPSFKQELLDVVDYIKFNLELVEISRYKTEGGEYLVTINKPQTTIASPATVRVMEEWNWEKYGKEGISKKKIGIAKALKEQLDLIVEKEDIDVRPIFRKLYIPYQKGRNNVFWLDLSYTSWTTGDVLLTFKIDRKPDLKNDIKVNHTRTRWLEDYDQFSIFFNKGVDLAPLVRLIKKSYEYVTGEKTET
jgi:hypothetical protein